MVLACLQSSSVCCRCADHYSNKVDASLRKAALPASSGHSIAKKNALNALYSSVRCHVHRSWSSGIYQHALNGLSIRSPAAEHGLPIGNGRSSDSTRIYAAQKSKSRGPSSSKTKGAKSTSKAEKEKSKEGRWDRFYTPRYWREEEAGWGSEYFQQEVDPNDKKSWPEVAGEPSTVRYSEEKLWPMPYLKYVRHVPLNTVVHVFWHATEQDLCTPMAMFTMLKNLWLTMRIGYAGEAHFFAYGTHALFEMELGLADIMDVSYEEAKELGIYSDYRRVGIDEGEQESEEEKRREEQLWGKFPKPKGEEEAEWPVTEKVYLPPIQSGMLDDIEWRYEDEESEGSESRRAKKEKLDDDGSIMLAYMPGGDVIPIPVADEDELYEDNNTEARQDNGMDRRRHVEVGADEDGAWDDEDGGDDYEEAEYMEVSEEEAAELRRSTLSMVSFAKMLRMRNIQMRTLSQAQIAEGLTPGDLMHREMRAWVSSIQRVEASEPDDDTQRIAVVVSDDPRVLCSLPSSKQTGVNIMLAVRDYALLEELTKIQVADAFLYWPAVIGGWYLPGSAQAAGMVTSWAASQIEDLNLDFLPEEFDKQEDVGEGEEPGDGWGLEGSDREAGIGEGQFAGECGDDGGPRGPRGRSGGGGSAAEPYNAWQQQQQQQQEGEEEEEGQEGEEEEEEGFSGPDLATVQPYEDFYVEFTRENKWVAEGPAAAIGQQLKDQGMRIPDGFVDAFRDELQKEGWLGQGHASATGFEHASPYDDGDMVGEMYDEVGEGEFEGADLPYAGDGAADGGGSVDGGGEGEGGSSQDMSSTGATWEGFGDLQKLQNELLDDSFEYSSEFGRDGLGEFSGGGDAPSGQPWQAEGPLPGDDPDDDIASSSIAKLSLPPMPTRRLQQTKQRPQLPPQQQQQQASRRQTMPLPLRMRQKQQQATSAGRQAPSSVPAARKFAQWARPAKAKGKLFDWAEQDVDMGDDSKPMRQAPQRRRSTSTIRLGDGPQIDQTSSSSVSSSSYGDDPGPGFGSSSSSSSSFSGSGSGNYKGDAGFGGGEPGKLRGSVAAGRKHSGRRRLDWGSKDP